jgi:GntR family transcriptional regulator
MEIDRKSHVPVYWQIKEDIFNRIMNGEYLPDAQIPSEPMLAEIYGVSRLTARNAVTELVNHGYLRRIHGQGTFVAKPRFEENSARFTGFYDSMTRKGYRVTSKVLIAEVIEADQDIMAQLDLSKGRKVYRVKRLRYAGKEPLGVQDVYLPVERCEGVLNIDLQNDSIYRFLIEEKKLSLRRAREKLEAIAADSENAQLLGVGVGAPLLYTRRLTLLSGDIPVDYSISWYRGDSYVFEVDIS